MKYSQDKLRHIGIRLSAMMELKLQKPLESPIPSFSIGEETKKQVAEKLEQLRCWVSSVVDKRLVAYGYPYSVYRPLSDFVSELRGMDGVIEMRDDEDGDAGDGDQVEDVEDGVEVVDGIGQDGELLEVEGKGVMFAGSFGI